MGASPAIKEARYTGGSAGPRIGRVDSLRALAMLAVIALHTHLLPFGWMGVWLFYVISGFVVTTSLAAHGASGDRCSDTLAFYARRAARILPIYDLYVVVGLVVSWLWLGGVNWRAFASLFLMYNNFAGAFGNAFAVAWPVGHLWTISVEWQFYLLFGVFFIWAPRRWVIGACLATIAADPLLRVAAGVLVLRHQPPLDAAFSVYSFSLLHFDAFAMGVLLALFRARLTARHGWLGLAAALVLLSAYVLVYATIDHAHGAHGLAVLRNLVSGILIGDGRAGPLYSIVDLAAASVVVLALDERLRLPLLGSRRLQFVGRISYGGYVYHQAMLWLVLTALPASLAAGHGAARAAYDVATFLLCAALTIAVAAASYRWLERPLIRRAGRHVDHALGRAGRLAPAAAGG